MIEVFIHTAEPDSTIEDTDRGVKIIDGTYTNGNFDKVSAVAVQLDKNE